MDRGYSSGVPPMGGGGGMPPMGGNNGGPVNMEATTVFVRNVSDWALRITVKC